MDSIRFSRYINGRTFEIVVSEINNLSEENREDADIKFYILPRTDDPKVNEKVRKELNSICNQALKIYKNFRK